MKQIQKIVCLVSIAAAATACVGQGGKFNTELADDDQGLILTAQNAGKGTAAGSEIDVLEGEHIVVTGNITSGAVQFRMVKDGNDDPTVEWTFTGTEEEIEYDVDPGNYMIGFTAVENKTTGTVSAVKKAYAVPEASGTAEDGQNPIMNFIGTYVKGRCFIEVSAADDKDGAEFSVSWSSSAWEHSEWHMSGTFDTETLTVNYENCEKKDVVFKEDGTVESETVVYENGKGSFKFNEGDASLIWSDEEEHQADGTVFGWALVE